MSVEIKDATLAQPENDASITFGVRDFPELIKLMPNGDIFVKGKLIENNKEIIQAFKDFFHLSKLDQKV